MSVVAALSLCACNTETAETTFDKTMPWHDSVELAPTGSYERLDYSVAIYDTTKGVADDKRIVIAEGEMSFELKESVSYTSLAMDFAVTYNDAAPEADRGKTDRIQSEVEFESNSLAAKRSEKTVTLVIYYLRAAGHASARYLCGQSAHGFKSRGRHYDISGFLHLNMAVT